MQEFLKFKCEEAISHLEKILKKERNASGEQISESITQEELNKRIVQSESDFSNNRFKKSSELLDRYE